MGTFKENRCRDLLVGSQVDHTLSATKSLFFFPVLRSSPALIVPAYALSQAHTSMTSIMGPKAQNAECLYGKPQLSPVHIWICLALSRRVSEVKVLCNLPLPALYYSTPFHFHYIIAETSSFSSAPFFKATFFSKPKMIVLIYIFMLYSPVMHRILSLQVTQHNITVINVSFLIYTAPWEQDLLRFLSAIPFFAWVHCFYKSVFSEVVGGLHLFIAVHTNRVR